MALWQRHLRVKKEWEAAQNGEICPKCLAAVFAEKLKGIASFKDEDIEEEKLNIIDEFEALAHDTNPSFDDFNSVLYSLYDWGDISLDDKFAGKKVCWIETF